MRPLRIKALLSLLAVAFMVILDSRMGLSYALGAATALVGGWAGWALHEFRLWYDETEHDEGDTDANADVAE